MELFTLVHVVISLIGIVSGLFVAMGMVIGKRLDGMTMVFLVTTVLTSVTGFFFPVHHFMPSHAVGILSLLLLAIAIYARYSRRLAGHWRTAYGITAMISLYLNVFVLIVQSFQKVPALRAMAPTQSEPPFAITQLAALVVFIVWTIFAVLGFRNAPGVHPLDQTA
jgi:hypothetical protein